MRARGARQRWGRALVVWSLLLVMIPVAGMGRPAAAQSAPPEAPPVCRTVVETALTAHGARYSQGGAHPRDPIDPATGAPYPRTGPRSFDCSGVVWYAYRAAGINVGLTTVHQATAGTPIPCTLNDLQGAATTCWAPGDLIFLRNAGDAAAPGGGASRHVALYVGNGLFLDCYNHATGCLLHDVAQNRYYRTYFWQARRIIPGCGGLVVDPGAPILPTPPDAPTGDGICTPEPPTYTTVGVRYIQGCGPPVLPEVGPTRGSRLRQLTGVVGWIGPTGRSPPAPWSGGVSLQIRLGVDNTDMCRAPMQAPGFADGTPPSGDPRECITVWMDPEAFLPLALADSAQRSADDGAPVPVGWQEAGDPALAERPFQLPPPGHPSTLVFDPPAGDPGGAWWSPGNDDRAQNARCPLGGPKVVSWWQWLVDVVLGWLFGC